MKEEETRQESDFMNQEEAIRCIHLSREALQAKDIQKAIKFARKSTRLYPSDEAQQLLISLIKKEKEQKSDYSLVAGFGYLAVIVVVAGLAIHLLYQYYYSLQKSANIYEFEASSSHSVLRRTNQLNVIYYVQADFTTMFHRKFRYGFDEFQREIEKKKIDILAKDCEEVKSKLDQISEQRSRLEKEEYKELKKEMKEICKAKRDLKNEFNQAYRTDL